MDKVELIQDLNTLTTKWVKAHNLFKGGCAYACAILSRELAKAGVDYEIVAFNPKQIDPIVANVSCVHLGICVKVGRKKVYLGGEPCLREKTKKTQCGKVAPTRLLDYYQRLKALDKWCSTYKTIKNPLFSLLCCLAGLKQKHKWLKPVFNACC